jgi:hypothetical protein
MKQLQNFPLGFLVSVIASAVILKNLPVDDTKFALSKLGNTLQSDIRLRDQVAERCATLTAKSATPLERTLTERLPVPTRAEGGPECTLVAQSAHSTRLGLRSFWHFRFQIRNEENLPELEREVLVEFPRPLILLPLVTFLLALVFEFRAWGIGWTTASYLFLLCGANGISLSGSLITSIRNTLDGELPWTGLFLLVLWGALCRGVTTPRPPTNAPSQRAREVGRFFLGLIGLWNPTAFSLAGKLLLPFRGSLKRVSPFLTLQIVAMAASLYLLAFDASDVPGFLSKSLTLPRYFTFGLLLFMYLEYRKPKHEVFLWEFPGFGLSLVLIAAFELVAWFFPFWGATSTLTRVGLALVLAQAFQPGERHWKRIGKELVQGTGILFLCAALSELSALLSATDLVLRILDPRIHPSLEVLFTFVSGLGLGFVSGSFSVAYFALTMVFMKSTSDAVIRAALIDGVLAGILLSPFSLLNWIPSVQFKVPLRQIVVHRFRQLSFPLLIGTLIYALSSINSVAILRPATFVFVCLLSVVFQLKKDAWRLGNYTIPPTLNDSKTR